MSARRGGGGGCWQQNSNHIRFAVTFVDPESGRLGLERVDSAANIPQNNDGWARERARDEWSLLTRETASTL